MCVSILIGSLSRGTGNFLATLTRSPSSIQVIFLPLSLLVYYPIGHCVSRKIRLPHQVLSYLFVCVKTWYLVGKFELFGEVNLEACFLIYPQNKSFWDMPDNIMFSCYHFKSLLIFEI